MPEEQHTMNPKSNPYNHSIIFQSWNVIYPVLIYFVVINLAMSLFAMLASFLGADYQKLYMALQAAATAAALPFLFRFYQRDQKGPATFWARMGREFARKTPAQKFRNYNYHGKSEQENITVQNHGQRYPEKEQNYQ